MCLPPLHPKEVRREAVRFQGRHARRRGGDVPDAEACIGLRVCCWIWLAAARVYEQDIAWPVANHRRGLKPNTLTAWERGTCVLLHMDAFASS